MLHLLISLQHAAHQDDAESRDTTLDDDGAKDGCVADTTHDDDQDKGEDDTTVDDDKEDKEGDTTLDDDKEEGDDEDHTAGGSDKEG